MKSLDELIEAMNEGDVENVTALVDNDSISFYEDDAEAALFSMHPNELQLQALRLLGIKPQSI